MENPTKMKVAGLRASLERRGLDSSGLKKVLQERLTAALVEEAKAESEPVALEAGDVGAIPMDEEPAAVAVPVEPVVPALVEPAPVDVSMEEAAPPAAPPAALARQNSLTAPLVPAAAVAPAAAGNAYRNETKQDRGMPHKPLHKPDQLGR